MKIGTLIVIGVVLGLIVLFLSYRTPNAGAQDTTQYDQNNQIIRQLEEQNDILKQILEVEKRIQERVEH